MTWHLVTADRYVDGPYRGRSGLTHARAEARNRSMDPRRGVAGFKKTSEGVYAHTRYRGFAGERWISYYIVSDDRLAEWPAAFGEYRALHVRRGVK